MSKLYCRCRGFMCENKLSSIYHIKLLTLYSDAVETIIGLMDFCSQWLTLWWLYVFFILSVYLKESKLTHLIQYMLWMCFE